MVRTLLLSALVVGLSASLARAQLVIGNDQTNPTLWLIDLTGADPPRALVSGTQATTWGLTASEATQTLLWNNGGQLFRASYSFGPLSPVNIGQMTVGGSNANVTGLALHTPTDTLYGYRSVTLPGFYSIDQNNAVMTLVAATPSGTDFGGFDYDPVTDAFYGLNDGTGLSGRGIYRIDNLTSGAPMYTFLAAYPAGDTDVDGLGIGNGRAYMVNDIPSQGIYVFNLTTLMYEPTLPSPFTGTNGIFSGGAWAPGLIPEPSLCGVLALAGMGLMRRRARRAAA